MLDWQSSSELTATNIEASLHAIVATQPAGSRRLVRVFMPRGQVSERVQQQHGEGRVLCEHSCRPQCFLPTFSACISARPLPTYILSFYWNNY